MVAATYQFYIDITHAGQPVIAADNLTDRLMGNMSYNVGMTEADQSFAPPSKLTVTLDNSDGAFNPDVIGADVLTNGDFSSWSGDNPTGWTVTGEVGADPEVSEVGPSELHGGSGTGACNFYSTSSSAVTIAQTVLTVGTTYRVDLEISASANATGGLFTNTSRIQLYHLAGKYTYYFNAQSTTFSMRSAGITDLTVNSVTVRPVSKYGNLVHEGMICKLQIDFGADFTYYIGKLERIDILPATNDRRLVVFQIGDWMLDLLDTEYVPPLYTNVTVDVPMAAALESTILYYPYIGSYWLLGIQGSSELDTTTRLFDGMGGLYDTGITTLAYAGDNSLDGQDGVSGQSYIRDLVAAEIYGRFFYDPSWPANRFHNRHRDALASSSYTLTENDYEPNMASFIKFPIINRSVVTFAPRSTGAAGAVIWSADDVPIGVFSEVVKITARYRDLSNPSARVGATNIIPLVAGTDYIIIEPSTGNDVTNLVSVTMTAGANSAEITIDNTRNYFAINVTTLQIRGTALKTFSQRSVTATNHNSAAAYQAAPEQISYSMIDTVNLAQSIADFRVYRNAEPVSGFKTIGWVLNKDSNRMSRGIEMAVGTRITVSNGWLQHSADYIVVGFRHNVTFNGNAAMGAEHDHTIMCVLKPCERETYWELDTSTLGVNTRLAL